MKYDIPAAPVEHIRQCRYVWLSHGHPDHANAASLELLSGKTFLVPDHAGHRMRRELTELGFQVTTLADRQWTPLSPRIRVMSVADYNQDGILLVDVAGHLLVDLNDAVERGWGRFVRGIVKQYRSSFLLKLFGYGDADMINIFGRDGRRLLPPPPTASAEDRATWDKLFLDKLDFWTRYFGTRFVIPFSAFHAYQRCAACWLSMFSLAPAVAAACASSPPSRTRSWPAPSSPTSASRSPPSHPAPPHPHLPRSTSLPLASPR
jgi:hypothetical protein